MKQKDVEVGGIYTAKVNGAVVPVRVTRIYEFHYCRQGPGVWRAEAVSLATGRRITLRSAQRLRARVPETR